MSGTLSHADLLSSAPILDAVERYRGTIVDVDTGWVVSPDELARIRESLAIAMRREGLAPGDRVVMAMANGPMFIATLTSILACEASPLLVHAKTPPAELARYAVRFGARFLAADPPEELAAADNSLRAVDFVLSDAARLRFGTFDVEDATTWGPELRGVPLHPTSGSTGLPKIALRPGLAATEEARHYAATMSIDSGDTITAVPPMSHAYGYGMCVMVPLITGANIVSTRRFSVKLLHQALEQYPISILPTVPAMLDVLSFGSSMDLRFLRWVLTAGAILPRRPAEQFTLKTGAIPCPLYGTTETGGISVATRADGRDLDGRVGPPMEGVEVEVREDPAASELGPGVGKLFVRSSSMMTGYLDGEGRMSQPQEFGWFETGDLARIDDDGTIHLRGRDSEVINVCGLKVVPCEVEEAIGTLPGVREVKVYTGVRRGGAQIVKAAVAVDAPVSEADIRRHCEAHLVYYKRPQAIAMVEALPRNPAGKIIRDQLP